MHFMDWAGVVRIKTKTPQNRGLFLYDGNVIGGLLLGIGMAVTGACPGTVLVQTALGIDSGLLIAFGSLLGGVAYVKAQPALLQLRSNLFSDHTVQGQQPISETAPATSIQETFGISTSATFITWVASCLAALYIFSAFDAGTPLGNDSPVMGGLAIGVAQAATLLLAGHSIGVSSLYEDFGRWVTALGKTLDMSLVMTPAVAFAAGIMAGCSFLQLLSPRPAMDTTFSINSNAVTPFSAIVGGAAMVFGSRLAGGCTCGHGISGLVTFSWASFVTVAAMLVGALSTAAVGY